ncbi:5-dehydro-4-deoxy-D-glucuronate isomerase [Inquilinus limosus]|uniref:4-deoxy-L-threo-5-hexosulose-uronate ketol-isomerase n=2 Tax=Inquilinus TaxID=171673 RepID=A0A0A0D9J5_9PROT|nr:5-dehydro-4-deoxy-D-glucuronate isomerase [Inquilinus limosus]KGM34543.1 5-keto-4-deoxyuronate isomerase [Inquilinus limosus MP06]
MSETPTTRQAVHYEQAEMLDGDDLRRHFLIEQLMVPGRLIATYTHYDRMLVAGAVPTGAPLAVGEDLAKLVGSATLLERRELGLINVGGAGRVTADGTVYEVGPQDALYLGRGIAAITFASVDPADPAKFYINSSPAHAAHPSRLVTRSQAIVKELGAPETSNRRTLSQYLHPEVLPTCQLLMGLTRLHSGSVWNTMPAHTHDRRMEAYFYFELPADAVVMHFMGRPEATRHLVVRNEQAVLSPPWSIHCGAGTAAYAFIWSMAGDNQAFTDMDFVAMGDLL